MTTTKPPAFDPSSLEQHKGSLYPEPFKSRMGDRAKRRLGEAAGLTQFGVNLVELGPHARSALRHFHTHEDELVYVLEGEVVLCTNDGEQLLHAGQFAAFKAGVHDGHCLVNRSKAKVRYLEIGSRIIEDVAHYPDDYLMWSKDERGREVAAHKDGKRY